MQNFRVLIIVVILCSVMCRWAEAQVVQVPSWRVLSIDAPVSIPDHGAVYWGGIDRAAMHRSSDGVIGLPLSQHVSSSETSLTGVHVRATIIDHQELDTLVLGSTRTQAHPESDVTRRSKRLTRHVASHKDLALRAPRKTRPNLSVKEIQRRQQVRMRQRQQEADRFFTKARKLEFSGQTNVAKIYYQMVVRRASGKLRARANAALAKIESEK